MNNLPAPAALPVVCTGQRQLAARSGSLDTILVTGAAGTVGSIAAKILRGRFRLVALDVEPPVEPEAFSQVLIGSVSDRDTVMAAVAGAGYILHLAGGAARGWDGLMEVEMAGTRNVVDAAITSGCARVILASSNHVAGWHELDLLAGSATGTTGPADPQRPDGLYAASKAFVEALGRSAAEYAGLPVSVLRIGTMRILDDPRALAGDPAFTYVGDPEMVVARMQRTWLYHEDFRDILLEELAAPETFRLRYAVSGDASPWSTDFISWSRRDC